MGDPYWPFEPRDELGFADFGLKDIWKWMFELPWRHSGPDNERRFHWRFWLIGWAWSLAGLVLGATFSPFVVQFTGLTGFPNRNALESSIALVAGVLVQVAGYCFAYSLLWLMHFYLAKRAVDFLSLGVWAQLGGGEPPPPVYNGEYSPYVMSAVAIAGPIAAVGYALYRYFTWLGPGQRGVTIAFVGALLVKTFLIPFIKGLVTGAIFRWFMRWLRGERAKAKGA